MKRKSISVNYFLVIISRLLTIVIPIISTPYLTMILNADGIGQYGYVSSYSSYFLIFGLFGFGYYGQRLISSFRNDEVKKKTTFIELLVCRFLIGMIATISFATFAIFQPFGERYQLLFYVEIITVASTIFNINFYFEGHEEFTKITIIDFMVKTISIVCVFIFVRTKNDVWIYGLIVALSSFVPTILMWPFLIKELLPLKIEKIRPLKHLLPCLFLFLPTIASRIYPTIDRTFIGLITKNDYEVGNYAKSQQIVDTCTGLITALGVVVAPRNAFIHSEGKKELLITNVQKAISFVFAFGLPMALGLISISNNLTPWYLKGDMFFQSKWLLMILAPTIILAGIRNVFGVQFFMSIKRDKIFVFSIIAGLLLNCSLTVPLVYLIGSYGAAISSVASELLICFLMILFAKKEISIKTAITFSWKYVVSALLMFLVCFPLSNILEPSIINTFIVICSGIATYTLSLIFFKDAVLLQIIENITKTNLFSFFYSKQYKKILFYILVFLILITSLSYSPIFVEIGINNYVFLGWLFYVVLSCPFFFQEPTKYTQPVMLCWFPFLIYILSSSLFLRRDIVFYDFTKEVFVSCFLFLVGALSINFIDKKQLSIIFNVSFYSIVLVSVNVFFSYFINFDFFDRTYAYPLKNSVAPLLVFAAAIPFTKQYQNMVQSFFEKALSLLLIVLVVLMKCRAVLIILPIIMIYLLEKSNFKSRSKMFVYISSVIVIGLIFAIPQTRNVLVDQILLAGRNPSDFNDVSSGRLNLIITAFRRFLVSPFTGIGNYYVDFGPLNALVVFGVFGFALLVPSFALPIITLNKAKITNKQLSLLFVILIIILFSNTFFEAYSPYGPGIKTFFLWYLSGLVLVDYFGKKELILQKSFSDSFEEIII